MDKNLKQKIGDEIVIDMNYCNEVSYILHDTIVNDNATPLTTSEQTKKVISELRILHNLLNKQLENL